MNLPVLEDRERIRRTQCVHRTRSGTCEKVDLVCGFRGGFRLETCDACLRVNPESEAAEKIRLEGIATRDEGTVRRGLHLATTAVILSIIKRSGDRAPDLIASLIPMAREDQIEEVAALYEKEEVREMIRAAWRSIDRDGDPLAQCTPCLRNKLAATLGQHAMSLSAKLADKPNEAIFVVKPVPDPSWTLAIACINEGPDLELTVASAMACKHPPREVVLVDDGSKEGLHDRVASLVERWGASFVGIVHHVRAGSGPSKHEAVARSTSDITVILDSHMRVPWDFYEDMRLAYQTAPTAVQWAVSTGFERTSWRGNYTRMRYREDLGHWAGEWCDRPPRDFGPSYRTPCPYGGCYILPKAILPRLGGYAPLLDGYGCEEEWLAFRAWITGSEIRCVRDLVVPHQYRRTVDRRDRKGTQPNTARDLVYNRHVILSCAFEDESIYGRYYAKGLSKVAGSHYADIVDEAAESVAKFRDFLRVVRRRTDEELMVVMGMKHPNAVNNTRRISESELARA